MRKNRKKVCIAFLIIVMLSTFIPVNVYAYNYSNMTAVTITESNQVVDSITVNGKTVYAVYRKYDGTNGTDTYYSCAAFVKRFYSEVYGIDVYNLSGTSYVPKILNGAGSFIEVSNPQVGDIVRDNKSTHWAIVKEVKSNGNVVLIQQNAWTSNRTAAQVGTYVDVGDSGVSYFRYSGNDTISFSQTYVENITQTNAVVRAELNAEYSVSQCGVYISRSANMSNSVNISEKPGAGVKYLWYDMNKWYGTLSKGTTYYYQFYIVKNGVETKSNISSFTTTGDGQNPVIDSVYVTDVTGDGYTVVCSVKDNVGIARVSFPTWTEANGQDDLVGDWYNNEAVMTPNADNLYVYRVNIANHNNEPGVYFTHVYAYDTAGNHASGGVTAAIYPLSSISLSASNESLQVGQQTYLSVYYNPDCTTENRSISWNSSDNNVATVSAEGTVTAVGTGQAVITVTVAGKTATCTVTVSVAATPVPTVAPTTAPTTEPAATPVPSEIKQQVEAFVSRMYTVVLDREAEAGGLNNWTNWLLSHEVDGAGIAEGFILSNEFKAQQLSDSDYLDVLYSTFFDREADEDGKNTWISLLGQGASREYVLAGFVNSVEFDSLCTAYGIDRGTMKVTGTSTGIRGFVERMYTTALERDADVSGMNTWTAQITTGTMTAEQVAKSFFFSDEFIAKGLSNEDYVETLYQTFMDRASDAEGKTMWVNLLNNGMTRTEVLEGFSRSAEFGTILESFGL